MHKVFNTSETENVIVIDVSTLNMNAQAAHLNIYHLLSPTNLLMFTHPSLVTCTCEVHECGQNF